MLNHLENDERVCEECQRAQESYHIDIARTLGALAEIKGSPLSRKETLVFCIWLCNYSDFESTFRLYFETAPSDADQTEYFRTLKWTEDQLKTHIQSVKSRSQSKWPEKRGDALIYFPTAEERVAFVRQRVRYSRSEMSNTVGAYIKALMGIEDVVDQGKESRKKLPSVRVVIDYLRLQGFIAKLPTQIDQEKLALTKATDAKQYVLIIQADGIVGSQQLTQEFNHWLQRNGLETVKVVSATET